MVNGVDGGIYQGYLYTYPHKTAYRPLRPRPTLRDVWAPERRESLFLYLHVPFCEMRCGFCNLFTRANPPADQVRAYLRQLRQEAEAVGDALDLTAGAGGFVTGAIGGGTPTYLTASELEELFDIVEQVAGGGLPLSVETSPATATPDRLTVLATRGVARLSMGVQSFVDTEAHAVGRPQKRPHVERALQSIRDAAIPLLNLDLIYGIGGQTASTWMRSLRAALCWEPEEIYLYPLYVRPLTGLGGRSGPIDDASWDEQRMALYRQGRDALRTAGYQQLSMRHFRRTTVPDPVAEYSCQEDAMVGLGCGARSYTTELHYSFDYAVRVGAVRAVIDDYLSRPAGDFAYAERGFVLDRLEQRRRWLVRSVLRTDGLDRAAWRLRFGDDVFDEVPSLLMLADCGWLEADDSRVWLTDEGLSRSDQIGPWLVSDTVRSAMATYTPR